jgi:hypothetical protein
MLLTAAVIRRAAGSDTGAGGRSWATAIAAVRIGDPQDQLDAAGHVELSKDLFEVLLDGVFAQLELPGDLPVRLAARDRLHDVGLPRGEPPTCVCHTGPAGFGRIGHGIQQRAGQAALKPVFPLDHGVDTPDHHARVDVPVQSSRGAE